MCQVALMPELGLLRLLDEEQWPRHTRMLLRDSLILARKQIAVKKMQPSPPSVWQWFCAVNQILPYMKVLCVHRGCQQKYNKV